MDSVRVLAVVGVLAVLAACIRRFGGTADSEIRATRTLNPS